jgi:hypothetical protein
LTESHNGHRSQEFRATVSQPKDKTANAKLAALHLTAEDRKACAKAILAWNRTLQAAEKATGEENLGKKRRNLHRLIYGG